MASAWIRIRDRLLHNRKAALAAMRTNLALWLIIAVCAGAPLAATILFVLQPEQDSNTAHGELLKPVLLTAAQPDLSDRAPDIWSLLMLGEPACGPACVRRLCILRQTRLVHLPQRFRIKRIWLLTESGPGPETLIHTSRNCGRGSLAQDRLIEVRTGVSAIPMRDVDWNTLPVPAAGQKRADYIYVVDPQGRIMMRYPDDVGIRDLASDLGRLLKFSRRRP